MNSKYLSLHLRALPHFGKSHLPICLKGNLPTHLGDCPSQTPESSALLTLHTLNRSPCTRVNPTLQLNVARTELIWLPSVNVTDPSAGAGKGGQSVNMKHTT